ncbi:MAG: hypothetical protein C4519_20090 [Desulfobacteraceae bacterium]|nr:MAG: hypothetical protein C4519_20090 [Desulfobacteraceae bacterium]
MTSEYLSSYLDNAESDIIRLTAKLLAKPEREIALALSLAYRQKGACHFFLSGQTHVFFNCLHHSAASYLFFLQNSRLEDKVTSESAPFFDAINCGLWDCADEMARHSRTSCNFDYEYEDDFLYIFFLTNHFFNNDSDSQEICKNILADYEKVIEGTSDTRIGICRAFLKNNSAQFNEHFGQFLIERSERIEKMIDSEAIGEDIWSWSRYFSTEGLSLLKLAELKSFKLSTNYSQIPEALRDHPMVQFSSDIWKKID